MTKNMNPSEDLTLSKFCERIESDNKNLCNNTQEIKTIDFDDLDFLSQDNIFKKPTWIFFRMKSTSHAVTVRFIEFCYRLSSVIFACPSF